MDARAAGGGHGRAWEVWRRAWCLVCLPGCGLALVVWRTGVVVEVALMAALVGAVCHGLALDGRVRAGRDRGHDDRWRSCGTTAAASAVVVVSLAATASISVGAVLLVLSGMTLSSPPVVAALTRRAKPAPQVPAQRPGQDRPGRATGPVPLALHDMSVAELCDAWRASFVALERARTVEQRVVVVAQRAAYLDELEVRDGAALRAWLETGARAAGGPDRFVLRDRRDPEPPRAG